MPPRDDVYSAVMVSPARPLALLAFVGLITGCPPSSNNDRAQPAPSAACTKFGANCEVSPGKLGTCVRKEPCDGPDAACLVCQSQH